MKHKGVLFIGWLIYAIGFFFAFFAARLVQSF